jgi:hypothetical protein
MIRQLAIGLDSSVGLPTEQQHEEKQHEQQQAASTQSELRACGSCSYVNTKSRTDIDTEAVTCNSRGSQCSDDGQAVQAALRVL